METRLESKTCVNDLNSDAAPGYAIFNARLSREFRFNGAKMLVYGRIDNLLDKTYAGSLIVNDNNSRYFEAAPVCRCPQPVLNHSGLVSRHFTSMLRVV